MHLSVIFPARNEGEILNDTLSDVVRFLSKKNYKYEVLVVVNGSSDQTKNIVEQFSKKHKSIKLLESKAGYGYALKKGLKNAHGKYVSVFNVDFYDLNMLRFAEIDLLGKDIIIGSKLTPWSQDLRPANRKLVSKFFNLFLRIVFGFEGSDTHGIKIMRKSVIDVVLRKCRTDSGIFDSEFIIRAQREGFSFADYPVVLEEKRSARFSKRLLDTPVDIYNLYIALNK